MLYLRRWSYFQTFTLVCRNSHISSQTADNIRLWSEIIKLNIVLLALRKIAKRSPKLNAFVTESPEFKNCHDNFPRPKTAIILTTKHVQLLITWLYISLIICFFINSLKSSLATEYNFSGPAAILFVHK